MLCPAQGSLRRPGAQAEKIDVVLDSADESIFDTRRHPPQPRREGRLTLITHGTIEAHVGIDTTIEAIALLADELPYLELQVYGHGSYVDELERLAEARGVRDRVVIQRDWVPLDELVDALARADAGVVAMKRDAFRDLVLSNKMYEFITMRRPILMSRTRAVEQYFGPKCFGWFEPDDPADLARAIRRLHDDPQWAQELVEHATQGNEGYRWVHHRERYLETLRRILSERRATPVTAGSPPAPLASTAPASNSRAIAVWTMVSRLTGLARIAAHRRTLPARARSGPDILSGPR